MARSSKKPWNGPRPSPNLTYRWSVLVFHDAYICPMFISDLCSNTNALNFPGVPEQTSELGVGSVAAHGPGHGHGEHLTLRRVQQTEQHTWGESETGTVWKFIRKSRSPRIMPWGIPVVDLFWWNSFVFILNLTERNLHHISVQFDVKSEAIRGLRTCFTCRSGSSTFRAARCLQSSVRK